MPRTEVKSLSGKRILILQQRGWGTNIGHFLAKRFAAEGARLAAITFKPSAHHFHANQKDVEYEYLVNNDDVMRDPKGYLAGDDYTLEEITGALGVDSIWPLIAASRNHIRSYGERYYYSYRQNVSDEDLVLYAKACYKYLSKLVDEFNPEVFITPVFSELPHLILFHLMRRRGKKAVFIADAKVRGIWIAVNDPAESTGAFYDRVDELNAGAETGNRERARVYIKESREKLKRPTYFEKFFAVASRWKRIRAELAPYRRIFEWYFVKGSRTDCIPNLGATVDCRPPRIILRDHFMHKRYARAAKRFPYHPAEKLGKFAYFPLQAQPEAVLDVAAPLFTNQLELARVIAMSLSGDYTLAVKDHPAMLGLRTPAYLEKLARTPNVKLIDYRVSSQALLMKAGLAVSANSTSLAEAALYAVPALQFGNQGTQLKLPGVVKHTDFGTLAKVIKEQMARKLSGPEYERALENYVAAAYDAGYEIDYIGAWEEGKTAEREKLWTMYRDAAARAIS